MPILHIFLIWSESGPVAWMCCNHELMADLEDFTEQFYIAGIKKKPNFKDLELFVNFSSSLYSVDYVITYSLEHHTYQEVFWVAV